MARLIALYSVSSQAEIERRARELFELNGCPAGRDLDHWLQAEADYWVLLGSSQASLQRANAG